MTSFALPCMARCQLVGLILSVCDDRNVSKTLFPKHLIFVLRSERLMLMFQKTFVCDLLDGDFAAWLNISQELCNKWKNGQDCVLGRACPYAHGEKELGTVELVVCGRVKTRICKFWTTGNCSWSEDFKKRDTAFNVYFEPSNIRNLVVFSQPNPHTACCVTGMFLGNCVNAHGEKELGTKRPDFMTPPMKKRREGAGLLKQMLLSDGRFSMEQKVVKFMQPTESCQLII